MRAPWWATDTLAKRFASTQVVALVITLALIGLFSALGGNWAKQPLDSTGLLNEVADIARIAESLPLAQRDSLAAAAGTSQFTLRWYAARSPESSDFRSMARADNEGGSRRFFDGTIRTTVTLEPNSLQRISGPFISDKDAPNSSYMLAVQLSDESWLLFSTQARTWGLPMLAREAIWLTFLALSVIVVSIISAKRVVKPVEQLVAAVRRFRVDAKAAPIAETGPHEIRNVIKTFNAMQAQIQQFVADRTSMLAAISHDLRTPLTRIRLRGEWIEDADQQNKLFRDVDEMQAMVDGALSFFRDDAVDESMTAVDLAALLQTVTNDYADQGVELTYRGPAHALYYGRPVALKRAFTNVIDNAIKYATPPSIELSSAAEELSVTVIDEGRGIPPQDLSAVFRPYYRVDKSRNRTTGGVGLGLTAAQAIIRGHGGVIALQNRPSCGLEVRIILPTTLAPADSAP